MSNRIIGADLGTTFSCCAIMEGDQPKVLTNSSGARTTPSVVAITEKGERLVGQIAKHQQIANPTNTIFSIKRFMGRKHNEVSSEEKLVPYKVVGNSDELVKVECRGKQYTPPEISAMVLQNLKKTAEDYLGEPVTRAVITVPAYFNDAQRQATKDAGEIAGLKVERIINEPTAAALAYGLSSKKSGKIAVYDLGGGTFDISILDIGDNVFEVLASDGDGHLGGDDYDEELINYVAEEFRKKEGIDLRKDPMALQRLKEACEQAKCELSTVLETTINLPFITADNAGPKHLQSTINRSKFEQMTNHLTERTREPVMRCIAASKLNISDIEEIVLVGGSIRMPVIQSLVKSIFNKEPNKSINPDEVVAIGAAIQGAILSGDQSDIVLLDVTPLTLGVETLGSIATPVIEANTTIPTAKSQIFSTASDNQTAVTIHVLQGNRAMASDNRSLGRFNLEGIPSSPRGLPQIEVTFDIDVNGILSVAAKDKATDKVQSIRIEGSSGLSREEIEKMKSDAAAHAEQDVKKKELVGVRNASEHLIYEAEKQLKEHGDKVSNEDKAKIESSINNTRECLKSDDLDSLQKSVKDLGESMQVIGKIIYEEMAKKQAEQQASNPENVTATSEPQESTVEENVVDAEFEEKTT